MYDIFSDGLYTNYTLTRPPLSDIIHLTQKHILSKFTHITSTDTTLASAEKFLFLIVAKYEVGKACRDNRQHAVTT